MLANCEEWVNLTSESEGSGSPSPSQSLQQCEAVQTTSATQASRGQPSPEVAQCCVSKQDIIIAVLGPTGSGKSSFVSLATGQEDAAVGHGLNSFTQQVQAIRCRYPDGGDRNVVLVDTPGFDDTDVSDADILASIARWLTKTYEHGVTLTGLIYLHRITDNRMAGAPLRNLNVFKQLCGKDSFQSIMLATTMWDDVDNMIGAQQREAELKNKYWKQMIQFGSQVVRFLNTKESAWDLIGQFPGVRRPLRLQVEMVDEGKPLAETAAGVALYHWLQAFIAQIRLLIASIENRMRAAPKDENISEAEEKKKAAIGKLRQANEQSDKLRAHGRLYAAVKKVMNQSSRLPLLSPQFSLGSSWSLSRSDTRSSCSSTSGQEDTPLNHSDKRLTATIIALRHARDIADMAPVPGLKGAAQLALTIAESIESMQRTKDALVFVAQNASRLVVVISEHARVGEMPDTVRQSVNDLVRELTVVQRIVKKATARGRPGKHYFLQPAEERLAVQCSDRIQFACQMFEIKSTLDVRQTLARLEQHILQLESLRPLPDTFSRCTTPHSH